MSRLAGVLEFSRSSQLSLEDIGSVDFVTLEEPYIYNMLRPLQSHFWSGFTVRPFWAQKGFIHDT